MFQKKIYLIALAVLVFALSGCKKPEEVAIENHEKELLGTWKTESIQIVRTDSTGKVVSDKTYTDQGEVEFKKPLEESSVAGTFAPVLFNDLKNNPNPLIGYFQAAGAGSATTKNGWAVYWEADNNAKRILFWGIQAGGSLHRTVNAECKGKSLTMWYVELDDKLNQMGSNRTFYTYKLTK
jgi:hypothetical protein